MPERHPDRDGLRVRPGQPLIGVRVRENGQMVTRYFTEEQRPADQAARQSRVEKARGLAGAWKDLDWDEMGKALDRIRHQSRPTPPIEEV